MWDYNISPEECIDLLEGKVPLAGHYTRQTLFKKMLESYPWFTIIEMLGLDLIRELLSSSVIDSLRTDKLRQRYKFINDRLSKTI
jgi:hypothetical protein